MVLEAIEMIRAWMGDQKLSLALRKTEAILFSGRRFADLPEIEVEGHRNPLDKELRFLGVKLDGSLTFLKHVKKVVFRERRPRRRRWHA